MLAFAAVGIFVPILPTTPFVIVAASCFASHPTLRSRITKTPYVGEHVENYKKRNGIPPKTVVVSLVFLWLTLTVSAASIRRLWAFALFAAVGAAVTAHIIAMSKPRKREGEKCDTLQ
jgi:uncharacterized membrane protein YbaN (DUF454 family)